MSKNPVKVLLIEDDPTYAYVVKRILTHADTCKFVVETVEYLSTALEWLDSRLFDVVLLDLTLPDSAALHTLTELSSYAPHMPIIVLTAHADEEMVGQALQSGAQDYLLKGKVTPPQLVRAIRYAIQRKKGSALLSANEGRYRALFDSFWDVVYLTNRTGKLVDINQAAVTLFGYTRDEFLGIDVRSLFVFPEDWYRLSKMLDAAGNIQNSEVKLRTKAGNEMTCLLTINIHKARNGKILGYQGIIRDITVRKSLEEMWRRYEFIVNTSKEFMTLIDRNYVYDATNESYCNAHGKARSEIVGRSVADVWGEERYIAQIKETLDQCFAGREVRFEGWLGFSILGKRYMDVTYYPYYNAEGVVTHAVVVSRDITERKQAEKALTRAHAQTQQLLASIPSILIGVDADDQITHWNRPAEQAFGVRAEAAIGHPFRDVTIQWMWEPVLDNIHCCLNEVRPTSVNDVRYTRPDGTEGFLNVTINPVLEASDRKTGFLLIGEDVTQRKILEGQLSQAQKLESIGQLAAGIAHEINTPTQYIGDNIRFLQDSFADLAGLFEKQQVLLTAARENGVPAALVDDFQQAIEDADVEFLVEEIPAAISQSLEGITHVSGIVRAMKEFSHPGVEEKTTIDINRAIESTITVARNEWKYVAEVETDLSPDLPLVPCFPSEFNQAVLNIIINAAHAISNVTGEQPNQKGAISISTRQDGNWVEVRITDTGGGIPEAVQPKIFDPFFTTKEVGKGTGQGLAITHSVIVEKHGGAIAFETQPGRGTTFIIRLPLDNTPRNGDL